MKRLILPTICLIALALMASSAHAALEKELEPIGIIKPGDSINKEIDLGDGIKYDANIALKETGTLELSLSRVGTSTMPRKIEMEMLDLPFIRGFSCPFLNLHKYL